MHTSAPTYSLSEGWADKIAGLNKTKKIAESINIMFREVWILI